RVLHGDLHSFPTRRSSDLRSSVGTGEASAIREMVDRGRRFCRDELVPCDAPVSRRVRSAEMLVVLPPVTVTLVRYSWYPVLVSLDRKSTRLNSSHVKISYA